MSATESDAGPRPRHRQSTWLRARLIGLEVLAAVVPALAFAAWAATIEVNPMERIGQISAMAELQLRFALVSILLVAAMVAAQRWGSAQLRALATRLGCAAIAGLATGLVAGGVVAALHGSPFGLWAGRDDYRALIEYIERFDGLNNLYYPPLFPAIMQWWAELSGQPIAYGVKELQIVGTAMFGPAAYLAWRQLLRPQWALAVGVVATLPFIEPVKPYPQITLVVLVPVLVALLRRLRRSADLSLRAAALIGVGYGVVLGLVFLFYSGWFIWLAPGLLAAAALLVPWRTGLRPALTLAGSATVAFLAVSFVHLRALLSREGARSDAYFYFDVCKEPTYVATWFNDRPFYSGPWWPLPGELGGVGLFTVLLAAGAGVALMLGWRRTVVIAIGAGIVSAWLMRMWLAGNMYATGKVTLYPRTTAVVLYGLLLLTGLGVYFAAEAVRRYLERNNVAPAERTRIAPTAILVIPLLFLFASAGSATIDKHMPNRRADSTGWFAWLAHTEKQYDTGICSPYAGEYCGEQFYWPENTPCAPGRIPPIEYRSLGSERRAEPEASSR